jgi:site-specific recombinase XerD
MKVTNVMTQKQALKVTYVLTHPGNLCPDICQMITDELEVLKEDMGEGWFVCSTRNNTIINRSNLWTIITGIYKRAGVDESGLHILRHTFARRLVNNNINLKTISELLGHADVAITAKFYAKTNETNKRAAVSGLV